MSDWPARAAAYRQRADAVLEPLLAQRRAGRAHPVYDFLFTYYSLRPRQLRWWHPGYGTVLDGDEARRYLPRAGYTETPDGVTVSRDYLQARADTVAFITELLAATAARPARFNCFGLHEWAMVYRAPQVRHGGVPMRLPAADTDAVVDSMPLRCSHFDAYRFFTEPAARRNQHKPSRRTQIELEQPGCVHAGMDLYKWSYKLGPLIDSHLVLDCFELALEARVLDMRASPYDLTAYGFDAIRVETPAGRREYAAQQQALSERAAPLRARLLGSCTALREAAART
ncbi:3-methyladenine DNA glycosylase [Mycobacterium sp. pV006]|uniref:3-methyladenine DNA glycosylase n=1 Tax=Mycobacterium sp. pV006 TaxID=3238983 RepID=UPI00351BA552